MDSKSLHYINKQTLRVEIVTNEYIIIGHVHVIYNHRASDMLNAKENFLAITDASITSLKDNSEVKKDFLAINKEQIIYLSEIQS